MFAKIDNEENILEYPVYIGTLRKRNPNKSLPNRPSDDVLSSLGYVYVQPQEKPQTDEYHTVTEGDPALIDGVWTQQWIVSEVGLSAAISKKCEKVEQERIARTQFMPWTIPSSGTQVEVKIAEEPPGKPRQTWLSGTCSWGLACVQEGTPDELDTLIAADDSLHSMTASEWVQFGKALKLWVRDNLMAAKQHMANVQALTDVQNIIDYDYSSGWPT